MQFAENINCRQLRSAMHGADGCIAKYFSDSHLSRWGHSVGTTAYLRAGYSCIRSITAAIGWDIIITNGVSGWDTAIDTCYNAIGK